MGNRTLWTGLSAFAGLFILILDSKTALSGASMGVELCIRTIIPSLFPFFMLSILLTMTLAGSGLSILKPLGRAFRIPRGAESILPAAFLGGYPTGAQSIAAACAEGKLDLKEGKRLLTYCNNAGPAFLFGMISPMFPLPSQVWLLWGIQILSAFLYARLTSPETSCATLTGPVSFSLTDALRSSLNAMTMVCGWVILFRVVLAFLTRWFLWLLPQQLQVAVSGILELANGCCALNQIGNISLRFLVCCGMLTFGGLCVTMQTMSVAKEIFHAGYFAAKLLQTLFSLVLAICAVSGNWLGFFVFPSIILLLSGIKQKYVEISNPLMYNADITQGRI